MKNSKSKIATFCILHFALCIGALGQEVPPAPSAPKSVKVPPVVEKKLANGLTVAVVQKNSTPIVTIQLLIKCGASCESDEKAGLADITAAMLTKGTKTRTATQIAEQIEFLGGSIQSGAGWNSSFVSVTVTSDKVAQAMAILSDVVLNPKFDQKELDLLKSQTLDELTYNLKQPSFLANYVASKYSFGEHPAGGTPTAIKQISKADVSKFHADNYRAINAVLIFSGNIQHEAARAFAVSSFSAWKKFESRSKISGLEKSETSTESYKRILVVDLPNSGQASVEYVKPLYGFGRLDGGYDSATVFNSVLGGGYSSRLNYEIRIKRGLSYGAGSSFAWRLEKANFATRAQTKNLSAAQVAELTLGELKGLSDTSVAPEELIPRKSALTGTFGRNLETTVGLATAVGELYAYDLPTDELDGYGARINAVSDLQIKSFARQRLLGGDIIIVGDYSVFKDDLAKRFPGVSVQVIKADALDLSKDSLQK